MVAMGPGGIDLDGTIVSFGAHQMTEHAFRRRRSTDVSHADKQHTNPGLCVHISNSVNDLTRKRLRPRSERR
jgi:hypothetical protein